jgi:hypothetical protein
MAQPEEDIYVFTSIDECLRLYPEVEPDALVFRQVQTKVGRAQLDIEARFIIPSTRQGFWSTTLVDCGCTTSCINESLVLHHKLEQKKLSRPIRVLNADGSPNKLGTVNTYVELEMEIGSPQGPHRERISLPVVNLGNGGIFLGYDWLRGHNPEIDWSKDRIEFSRCPAECSSSIWIKEADNKVDVQERVIVAY